mmetsp:Transcript_49657/g.91690  ORF Transcript_49657/g.91690 Transcript_49657/m.91690 type:complete len:280 (-) Transcript_49657:73-912(-)
MMLVFPKARGSCLGIGPTASKPGGRRMGCGNCGGNGGTELSGVICARTGPTGNGRAEAGAGVMLRSLSGLPEVAPRGFACFCSESSLFVCFCRRLRLESLLLTTTSGAWVQVAGGSCTAAGNSTCVSETLPSRLRREGDATLLLICGDTALRDAPRRFFGETLSSPHGDAGIGCNGVPLKRGRRRMGFVTLCVGTCRTARLEPTTRQLMMGALSPAHDDVLVLTLSVSDPASVVSAALSSCNGPISFFKCSKVTGKSLSATFTMASWKEPGSEQSLLCN